MATALPAPNPHPAESLVASLRCPECGETVYPVPPIDWPLSGFRVTPDASHADGTALCPVPGPHGSQPGTPVAAPVTGAAAPARSADAR